MNRPARSAADPAAIVAALRQVLGTAPRPVALHEPLLGPEEQAAVAAAVAEGWVSTAGPAVARFEAVLASLLGVPHAIAASSGTAALQLALEVAGVGPGDEVVLPALTFVATANAVAYRGAHPHFADVEPGTLGLDAAALDRHLDAAAERRDGRLVNRATGRRIAALLPVHAFGLPADAGALAAVAARHGLPLVEDAAEALGSTRGGRAAGTQGLAGALSFNGNKIVTTGGGGALVTADADLAARARHLAATARLPHAWAFDHDRVGYNVRMPALNAALGLAQLARLPALLAAKARLHAAYRAALAGLPGVALHAPPSGVTANHWLNVLLLDRPDAALRDAVLAACHAAGLHARPAWTPLHRLPMYARAPCADLAVTEALAARIVCLPSGPRLGLALP